MSENKADPMREAFKFVDDLDWDYLERVLINNIRHSQDAQNGIWLTAMKAARSALAAPQPAAPNPNNLPDTWEYQAETNCVVCSGCMFRYGAEHPDGDGKWTCPNCGDGNGNQSAKPAAPLGGRDEIVDELAELLDRIRAKAQSRVEYWKKISPHNFDGSHMDMLIGQFQTIANDIAAVAAELPLVATTDRAANIIEYNIRALAGKETER